MTTRKAVRARMAGRNGKHVRVASGTSIFATRLQLPIDQARWFDLEAGVEMQHGHHAQAERLARRAAELRGQT